jgi:hypothetical protein
VLVFAVTAVILQEDLFERRKIGKALLHVLLVLLPLVAIYRSANWVVKPEKSPGYEEQFLSKDIDFQEEGKATVFDILERVPRNFIFFVKGLFPLFFGRCWHEYFEWIAPGSAPWINAGLFVLGGAIFVLMVVGFIREVTRKPTVVEYYLFFYLAIMSVIWFNYEVYRYLMLITFLLLFYFFAGLQFVLKKARIPERVFYGCLIGLFAVNVVHAGAEIYKYKFSRDSSKIKFAPYLETVTWLKSNVVPGQMIVADDPRWYALETGLSVTLYPISRDTGKVCEYIRKWPDAVIVYDPRRRFSDACLLPVLEQKKRDFTLVREIGHLKIYRTASPGGVR